eukprot:TRINITY_DN3890_c0_g2_i1.p1 TRINITY_DN3890_c0_g2~~TRINITY_DN3890_c0_g2_i1.p1  ORF type:complete len:351 (+),score=85.76 TRINITY_DN3890_c0_g2_i1:42-1094(+)
MSTQLPAAASRDSQTSEATVDALAEDFAQKVAVKDEESEEEESDQEDEGDTRSRLIEGACNCGGCRFQFFLSEVEPNGRSGQLEMANCYCEHCRRAHAAAFATYVTVPTAAVKISKGSELVRAIGDRCDHLEAEVLRAHCSKCFSSLATFPRVGSRVHVPAGCLEVKSLPEVDSFIPWCKELAPPYLGFVPATKKKRLQAKEALKAKGGERPRVTGGCACGACRYSLKKLPEEFQHCYCGNCRVLSGAAWQTWMPVEDGHLSWTCKDGLKLVRTASHARRHVCKHCGVFMTIVYDEDGAVWPLAGSLDDDCYSLEDLCMRVTDVSHICVKFKQPWWTLPKDGLQRIKGPS